MNTDGRGQARRAVRWLPALVILLMLVGCKPKDGGLSLAPAPANAPTSRQIIASHNERVAKLATTYSRGVVEVSWRDEHGKHQHQGDLDFYRAPVDCTALSITAVGERLFWLGSSEQEYWFFDLSNKDDRVLYRGMAGDAAGGPPAMQAFGVKPHDLLELLALQPIDESFAADQPPLYDGRRKAYIIDTGRVRLFFDRTTLLPVRVELLTATGEVAIESTHARYDTVDMPGIGPLARPRMAELIDIRPGPAVANDPNAAAGEVKIAINDTTTVVDQKQLQRVFDLEALMKALQPDRLEQTPVEE